MGKQEELKQAVEALTDEDIAELAGGKLSAKGEKIAKIAGMVGGGLVGAAGLAAGVMAIAGEVKHKDGAYYFKEMFGGNKLSTEYQRKHSAPSPFPGAAGSPPDPDPKNTPSDYDFGM